MAVCAAISSTARLNLGIPVIIEQFAIYTSHIQTITVRVTSAVTYHIDRLPMEAVLLRCQHAIEDPTHACDASRKEEIQCGRHAQDKAAAEWRPGRKIVRKGTHRDSIRLRQAEV